MLCFMCTSMETNRVRDSEHPNQEEWKIRRQQQSIASCIHAAPTSKQLLPPETTADSTNPRTAEEEAETNHQALTLDGPSTSIDVFSFRNACKMASVKSYDTIFSEFYFFINTCLLSKFQDFSASGYRKKYVTT